MLAFLYVSLIRVALWRKLVIRQTVILQLSIFLTRSVFVYPHIELETDQLIEYLCHQQSGSQNCKLLILSLFMVVYVKRQEQGI